MATVGELVGALSRFSNDAASWDKVGLQLGDPAAPVAAAGVCHEVTDEVVNRALADQLDLLVAYHPLLFVPTTSLVAGSWPSGRAHRLIAGGVALHVVHTGWDVHPGGTADSLAAALGLTDVTPFGADDGAEHLKIVTFVPAAHADRVASALAEAGAGQIGDYSACSFATGGVGAFLPGGSSAPVVGEVGAMTHVDEQRLEMILPQSKKESVVRALHGSHPYEEPAYDLVPILPRQLFIGRVGTVEATTLGALEAAARKALQFEGVRRAGAASTPIRRVAVVPGSGSSFLRAADAAGADVLVTGDVGHHRAVEALDRGISVLDVGHAPGERPGMTALYDAVCNAVEVRVSDLTDAATNPWEHQ